jgi:hypothetical protein
MVVKKINKERHIAGTKWGLQQYLKMDRIEELEKESEAA